MSCLSISRPKCARRVRSLRRSIVCPLVVLLALLSLALVGSSAVAAADHVAVDAPLTLDTGLHAVYEPSPELLVAVDAERVAGANGLVGLEVTTERGRAIVDWLGSVAGWRGVVERHWISAVVVATEGVGRHVFRVRSVSRDALGDLRIRVVGDAAPSLATPFKVEDNDPPRDDDSGDILLVDSTTQQVPATVDLSIVGVTPLAAPSIVPVKAETTGSGGGTSEDDGDILFTEEQCPAGSSVLCPIDWHVDDGTRQLSIVEALALRVGLSDVTVISSSLGSDWTLTVYDGIGQTLAPAAGAYVLGDDSYVLWIERISR